MNKKKMSKRQRDIKSKLMAAICMLLVSSIMMVSTTYAWFTLSTAPEVTGITTAVGANGNLEMALQRPDGNSELIASSEGDSNKVPAQKNITWGNLVDLADTATYGLDLISLYPSELNYAEGSTDVIGDRPLSTPVYGADGRIKELSASTLTGGFNAGKRTFVAVTSYAASPRGVRAVGNSSDMTARQLAHSSALANGISYSGMAQNEAMKSLQNRGNGLANIAVKHAMGKDGSGYNATEIGYIQGGIEDLKAAMEYLEVSLKNFIVAQSIAPSTVTDDTYTEISTAIMDATIADLRDGKVSVAVLPTTFAGPNGVLDKFVTMNNKVSAAATAAAGLQPDVKWEALSPVLGNLINMDSQEMTINGMQMKEIREDPYTDASGNTIPSENAEDADGLKSGVDVLIDNVMGSGSPKVTMEMRSDTGIYADIADFTGRYTASTNVSVSAAGISVKAPTDMIVIPTADGTVYLDTTSKLTITGYQATDGGSTETPISEFYGYIIDLAFRTNAANSSLLLQQTGIDRIYSDNTANDNTMGHGATMTFKSASTTFAPDQVASLMEHIRIVFFDTDTRKIVQYAKLDMAKATQDAATQGYTAPIALTGANFALLTDDDTTADIDESVVIMELTQNEVHELSVLVYLDGNTIQNEDVAADQAKSMTGTMNLQFSSSATLVPMEYSALRTESTDQVNQYVTIPAANITTSSGYSVVNSNAYATGGKLAFALNGTINSEDKVYVSIDGATAVQAQSETVGNTTGYYVTAPATLSSNSKVVITVGSAFNANKVTVTGNATAPLATFKDGKVTVVLKANDGNTITGVSGVTVGGTTVSGASYKNGVLTFESNSITADSEVAITVVTTVPVTIPEGVSGNPTATIGANYTFAVSADYTLGTVTVNGTTVTPSESEGTYTVTGVNGPIVITATKNA